jgi:hypothetical protein
MNLERYPYAVSASLLVYTFESVGPKGGIQKMVRYDLQNVGGISFFNLVFGNCSEGGAIDTLTVSNNGDRAKLLSTVAATVLEVTSHFPDIRVYAKGSTPARTRLYQMGIFHHWELIAPVFDVYAFTRGSWVRAKRCGNYEAFVVRRKYYSQN